MLNGNILGCNNPNIQGGTKLRRDIYVCDHYQREPGTDEFIGENLEDVALIGYAYDVAISYPDRREDH